MHAKFVCGFYREVTLLKITAKVMVSCLYTQDYYRKYNAVYLFTYELQFSDDGRESIHIN